MRFIGLCFCAITLAACGGDTPETKNDGKTNKTTVSEKKSEDDMKGMHSVNLIDYDIDASLFIPDDSKGKAEFLMTDAGALTILVGNKYGIELMPYGLTVSEKKEELANDLVYTIEYLKDEPDLLVYKKTIADSEMEPDFHFFMNTTLGEDNYEIKSLDNHYSKKAVEKMIQSARSLSAN